MAHTTNQFSCIILSGGEGKRAGGLDKGLIVYNNLPLVEHVINTVKPQVDDIVISANRHITEYQQYGYKVISDLTQGFQGPLAGIAAALPYCQHERVLVVACDMPNLPLNLVERLACHLDEQSLAVASVGNHHQLAMLMNQNLIDSLEQQLQQNQLKLIRWIESQPHAIVPFDDTADAFLNLNKL
jgi:molybdenum cofactor guanylyltransferase